MAAVGAGVLVVSGCSDRTQGQWKRFAMPDPASEQGERILSLWQGAWIAALITGLIVWGLIFYAIIRFRRRNADEIPVQTRYNLPLEIFYTIAPVIMVIVFFAKTVDTQNYVLDEDRPVDNCMEITGQQWSWTFNYGVGEKGDCDVTPDTTEFPYESYVYTAGTGSDIPDLYLPVGETTRFNLHSPDVIHDFGVPGFLMKMDVIPGRVNHYAITPTTIGDFKGKCYELCGTYHSRMLFNVHVVSREDYDAHLRELEAAGNTSDLPLIGGEYASTQAGLEAGQQDEEEAE
ncbi:cytochrome c oxidase subunit II [Nocardioides sp. MAH-18]|uniref:Cytochrome c oxidase subunit 2 n=1 Tax=Nocardioides agri TaxID=2682843 RepID=A0A6L6XXJ1_9ACTN|nr:cytochrome c oxidase subunit II [Nocardioides sp. CGMCC 1.13656]MVQ51403.1 cytochrome c oxidase subunit II [Nocardioides sp. MAH-18]